MRELENLFLNRIFGEILDLERVKKLIIKKWQKITFCQGKILESESV
jgi:hypothetical protein